MPSPTPASPDTPDDFGPAPWDEPDASPWDREEGALDAEDRYIELLGGRDE